MTEKKELNHVAFIMDGNRRWAKDKGLKSLQGHEKGRQTLDKLLTFIDENTDIKYVTVYAWSLKNQKRRTLIERQAIFRLASKAIDDFYKRAVKNETKLIFSGRYFETDLKQKIEKVMQNTKKYDKKILNICFMYDGQTEIIDAIKNIIQIGTKPEQVTKKLLKQNMYTKDLPAPELIIRTGMKDGKRLSGFLLWDSSYSEFIFHDTYWPDYTPQMYEKDVQEYYSRNRRMGK